MKINLLLFAHLQEVVGKSSLQIELEQDASGNDLLDSLCKLYPAIEPLRKTLGMALNDEYMDLSSSLPDGAQVALIPPVSGG